LRRRDRQPRCEYVAAERIVDRRRDRRADGIDGGSLGLIAA